MGGLLIGLGVRVSEEERGGVVVMMMNPKGRAFRQANFGLEQKRNASYNCLRRLGLTAKREIVLYFH